MLSSRTEKSMTWRVCSTLRKKVPCSCRVPSSDMSPALSSVLGSVGRSQDGASSASNFQSCSLLHCG
eukprot:751885-Hanusia_phi.AAC.2